jgi:hypothetical protein
MGEQLKKNEMGGAYDTNGSEEKLISMGRF